MPSHEELIRQGYSTMPTETIEQHLSLIAKEIASLMVKQTIMIEELRTRRIDENFVNR